MPWSLFRVARPVRRLAVVHLVLLTLSLSGGFLLDSTDPSGLASNVCVCVMLALGYTQGVLGATWLALGPGALAVRLGQTLLSLGCLWALTCAVWARFDPNFLGLDWETGIFLVSWSAAPLGFALVPAVVARWFGWRWLDDAAASRGPIQFSVQHALIATVLAAGAFAAARAACVYWDPFMDWLEGFSDSGWREYVVFVVILLVGIAAPSYLTWSACVLATAACVGPRPRWVFIVAALAASGGLGLIPTPFDADYESRLPAALLTLGAALCTVLSMLALYAGGYRIDRLPLPLSAPPEALAAPARDEA
ncbi:MAG TPA: hypothetical protein VGE52_16600 [Pirellulales bacterium]